MPKVRRPNGRVSSHAPISRKAFFENLESRTLLAIDFRPILDINSDASSFEIQETAEIGSVTYFTGGNSTRTGLWKTDGTAAGTVLVKDFSSSSYSLPRNLTPVNNVLFFSARGSATGEELWKSDGTGIGTVQVKDIEAGPAGSYPQELVNVSGTLFFISTTSLYGSEVWKSDGTASGTDITFDVALGSASLYPADLTAVGSTVFFTAETAAGRELFKSDGTRGGTAIVRDIVPGGLSSYPHALTNVNGTLYFAAYTATTGDELWRSDGSSAGTLLVKDIATGTGAPTSKTHLHSAVRSTSRPTTGAAVTNFGKAMARQPAPCWCATSIQGQAVRAPTTLSPMEACYFLLRQVPADENCGVPPARPWVRY